MQLFNNILLLFITAFFIGWAKGESSIDSTGSFNCAADADNAIIQITSFKFLFSKETSSVYYSATGTSKQELNGTAKISLTIYGIKVAEKEVKFCQYGVRELCPIPKDTGVTISGNHSVPAQYVSSVSDVAFTIPDIEGNILIQLYDVNDPSGAEYGCFRSDITNGKSTQVASAKWGTAIAAIIALVIAIGSSAASSSGGGAAGAAGSHAAGAVGVTGVEGSHAVGTVGVTGAEGHAAGAAGVTGSEGHAATSGPGTNVTSSGFNPPGLAVLLGWLQAMAVSGVYSVNYPKVYRNFTRNFSWSMGVLQWEGLEKSIDQLRKNTGGNLTANSVETLRNTTLYEDQLPSSALSSLSALSSSTSSKRATFGLVKRYTKHGYYIVERDITVPTVQATTTGYSKYVSGIQAYLEKNNIPQTNGFTTLLIWWAIIVAALITFMLGFKLFLELYYSDKRMEAYKREMDLYEQGSLPELPSRHARFSRGSRLLTRLSVNRGKSEPPPSSSSADTVTLRKPRAPRFQGYRKNYLHIIRVTLIRVIVILYGVWVLLTLYQFKLRDSWATTLLAALTFSLFTIVLMGYAFRVWYLANIAAKQKLAQEADMKKGAYHLFEHKPWISRYGVFYDEFKVSFWWVFMCTYVAVFGRNAFIALGVGHPLIQIFGQLAIDVLLCVFFSIYMPFNTKMGNGLNILIQVVRVVSLVLTFLFTDVVGLSSVKSTAVGFVLVAIQSLLTALLILLILANFFRNAILASFYRAREKRRAKKGGIKLHDEKPTPLAAEDDDHLHGLRDSIQLIDLDSPTEHTAKPAHENIFMSSEEFNEANHETDGFNFVDINQTTIEESQKHNRVLDPFSDLERRELDPFSDHNNYDNPFSDRFKTMDPKKDMILEDSDDEEELQKGLLR